MIFFPNQTVARRDDVVENVKLEFRKDAVGTAAHAVVDQASWDEVDQASWESFPASDAPPWTLGCTGSRHASSNADDDPVEPVTA